MIKGIFGGKKSRFQWDDEPVTTPPINPGYPQEGAGMQAPQAAIEPQQKVGFFQRDGTQDGIATFADTLVKLRGGIDPGLMDARRQQQRQQFAEAQYERKRTDDFQDWVKQQDYARDNPKPVSNDTANDYTLMEARVKAGLMTPDQFKTWEENNILNPTWKQGWNGQWAQPGQSGGTYGAELPPGITLDGEGGATGNGGGNFPR